MSKCLIPIYKDEAEISNKISEASSFAYISPIISSLNCLSKKQLAIAEIKYPTSSFDLYPIMAILVSTGWNKNDDFFGIEETWSARQTAEDKPFNIEHEPRNIIGHITANIPVDDNLDEIMEFTDIPHRFHILTNTVVYRHLNSIDEELSKESEKLIEEIQNQEWAVSMECIFTNFDYAAIYQDGREEIIKRCESTAYLTKHLRRYGGTGQYMGPGPYNGVKIGRALRNITFSGKGLVKTPANPDSVIFNDISKFSSVSLANIKNFTDKEKSMDNEEKNKNLEKELAAANKKIEELGEAQIKAAMKEKEDTIETLQAEIAGLKIQVEQNSTSLQQAISEKSIADEALVEAKQKLETTEATLAKIAEETKISNRISSLTEKGVDKAEASRVVEEFNCLDDEKFSKMVDIVAKTVVKAEEVVEVAPADVAPVDVVVPAEIPAEIPAVEPVPEAADIEGSSAASRIDIEEAVAESEVTLASNTKEEEDLMTSLANFIDETIH
jgi:hypothetical protein